MNDGQQAETPGEDGDWIDVRVRRALEAKAVDGATATLLKGFMRSKMADRQLPSGELAKLAKELIASAQGAAK